MNNTLTATHDTTNSNGTLPSLEDIAEAAREFTENLIPVLILQHGLKKPYEVNGTWATHDDPDEAEEGVRAYYQHTGKVPNLGILLHPKMDSHLICVDVDGCDTETVEWLKSRGVSRGELAWTQITGKGNGHYHIFYWWTGDELQRQTKRAKDAGYSIDLLSNGYSVVAPSNTYLEKDGGGPYKWIKGRSPAEIYVTELELPPDPLIAWWQELQALGESGTSGPGTSGSSGKAWTLLQEVIPEGQRNGSLFRIAAWLRQYHPQPVVEELMLAINEARCDVPLDRNEVLAVARSPFRYPQSGVSGHPRAIVNPWRSEYGD